MSKTINTEKELRDFVYGNKRAVVVLGRKDCLHCSIVETIIEDIEKYYPLVAFGFTADMCIAEKRHIDAFPVLAFYENGILQGTLHGSGKITFIKEMLNLWFLKD